MATTTSIPTTEVSDTSDSVLIQTTLYDLIAALGDSISPSDNTQTITAMTRQFLCTHRVMYFSDLAGRRITVALASARNTANQSNPDETDKQNSSDKQALDATNSLCHNLSVRSISN